MSLPGTSVGLADTSAAPRGASRFGATFLIGTSERGPLTPVRVTSKRELQRRFGQDVSYGDIIPVGSRFFDRGGRELIVRRDVGPSATYGTKTLANSVPATVATLTTREPGAWSDDLKVQVAAGVTSSTVVLILTILGEEVERSPELASKQELLDWPSAYVTIASGVGTGLPAVAAAASFSEGADDLGSISTTTFQACLDSLTYDLGGGQLVAPAYRTDTHRQKMAEHATDTGRFALPDVPASATVSTLTGAVAAVPAADRRYMQPCGPDHKARVAGVVRNVPASIEVAAAYAEADRLTAGGIPRLAAAGPRRGVIEDSLGPNYSWAESDLATLNANGVTVIRTVGDRVQIMGARTGSSRLGEEDAPGMRVVLAWLRSAQDVIDNAVFEPDTTAGDILGDVAGIAVEFYQAGAVVGSDPADAVRLESEVETITGGVKQLVITASILPVGFLERIELTVYKRF